MPCEGNEIRAAKVCYFRLTSKSVKFAVTFFDNTNRPNAHNHAITETMAKTKSSLLWVPGAYFVMASPTMPMEKIQIDKYE